MKKHILIVHPNAQALREMRELFASAGYPVMTATDWDTAERLSARFPTDLIIAEPDRFPAHSAGGTASLAPPGVPARRSTR